MEKNICNNEKKYISDIIGNAYKEWGREDTIFLTASTGAGKSQFILHDFLEWQIQQTKQNRERREHRNILYLVNRKILKKQIQKDLEGRESDFFEKFRVNYNNYITIATYHNLENGIKKKGIDTIKWMKHFWCVICDECHYFYTDSNFNTETELSYLAIREVFDTKLQIYISATADKVKKIYKNI